MRLILLRHGETESNKKNISFNSGNDEELTENGKKQIKKVTKYLKDLNIDIIYSSKAIRTLQSAEIISKEKFTPIIQSDLLDELNFGIFAGHTREYVERTYPREYNARKKNKFQYRITEGESYKMVYSRVQQFMSLAYNPEKNILVVSHATTLKLFFLLLTGKSLKWIENQTYNNACISVFDVQEIGGKFKSRMIIFNLDIK